MVFQEKRLEEDEESEIGLPYANTLLIFVNQKAKNTSTPLSNVCCTHFYGNSLESQTVSICNGYH